MKRLTEYTVIDIETPNRKNDSICSIAIVSIKDNKIVRKEEYLVNPEDTFDNFNVCIHHINGYMIKDKPNFKKVWEQISKYFTNGIIVGHNVTFDLDVICKTLNIYQVNIPDMYYLDTYILYKKLYKELEKYSLDYLCNYFNINLDNHHNALCDAMACNNLLTNLLKTYEITDDDIQMYNSEAGYCKTATSNIIEKSINNFYGTIKGIVADKKLKDKEIKEIKKWVEENYKYKDSEPYCYIINKVELILQDEIITENEKIELLKISNKYLSSKSFSEATLSMQILMGIINGISCDGELNLEEINELKIWLEDNKHLSGNYPFDLIYEKIGEVLEDNKITIEESEELIGIFNTFLNPTQEKISNEIVDFYGKTICLTGNFTSGSKLEVGQKLEEKGGTIVEAVKSNLDILVVGEEGSAEWSFGNYGTKVKKAMELNNKGKKIKIISEQELLKYIS